MGRKRVHDEKTRELLLATAESLVAEGGLDAIGVRPVAERAGTSTRAVYSLFGSKDGLVQALAERSFQLVAERVDQVPISEDPGEDLVQAAVLGFRAFALEHPDLFRLFFMPSTARSSLRDDVLRAAIASYERLVQRVQRAEAAGLLGGHSAEEVTDLWDSFCCGLAMREVCGVIDPARAEHAWTAGLRALLAGLNAGRSRGEQDRSSVDHISTVHPLP